MSCGRAEAGDQETDKASASHLPGGPMRSASLTAQLDARMAEVRGLPLQFSPTPRTSTGTLRHRSGERYTAEAYASTTFPKRTLPECLQPQLEPVAAGWFSPPYS